MLQAGVSHLQGRSSIEKETGGEFWSRLSGTPDENGTGSASSSGHVGETGSWDDARRHVSIFLWTGTGRRSYTRLHHVRSGRHARGSRPCHRSGIRGRSDAPDGVPVGAWAIPPASRRLIDQVGGRKADVAEPGRRGDSGRRHPRERLPLQGVSGDIPVPCRAGLPALGEVAPPQRGIAGRPTGTPEPDLSHFARRLASVAGGYEPPPGY